MLHPKSQRNLTQAITNHELSQGYL